MLPASTGYIITAYAVAWWGTSRQPPAPSMAAANNPVVSSELALQSSYSCPPGRITQPYVRLLSSSPWQDNEDNVTRFMVLAREPLVVYNPEPGAYKTSIVFSMQEGPGQLYKVGRFPYGHSEILKVRGAESVQGLSARTWQPHYNAQRAVWEVPAAVGLGAGTCRPAATSCQEGSTQAKP